jgi:hypothetical protein
MHNQ